MEDILDQFDKIRQELEQKTNKHIQLTITQFAGPKIYLGKFSDLKNIKVFNAIDKYEILNGIYQTNTNLLNHIKEQHYNTVFEETKFITSKCQQIRIGKCKLCKSYNDKIKFTRVIESFCNNCGIYLTSNWLDLNLDYEHGLIYISDNIDNLVAEFTYDD